MEPRNLTNGSLGSSWIGAAASPSLAFASLSPDVPNERGPSRLQVAPSVVDRSISPQTTNERTTVRVTVSFFAPAASSSKPSQAALVANDVLSPRAGYPGASPTRAGDPGHAPALSAQPAARPGPIAAHPAPASQPSPESSTVLLAAAPSTFPGATPSGVLTAGAPSPTTVVGGTRGEIVPYSSQPVPPDDFELDTNHSYTVNQPSDLPVDKTPLYLPGYAAGVNKLTTGTQFNAITYTGQNMSLVLNHGAKPDVNGLVLTDIYVSIFNVTQFPGYCQNGSDVTIKDPGMEDDYSFLLGKNSRTMHITKDGVVGGAAVGSIVQGPEGLCIEFYCKDFGGACHVIY